LRRFASAKIFLSPIRRFARLPLMLSSIFSPDHYAAPAARHASVAARESCRHASLFRALMPSHCLRHAADARVSFDAISMPRRLLRRGAPPSATSAAAYC